MIYLFDITEQCHTPHDPVFGPNVTLKIYGTNVVQICPGRLAVYGALIEAPILA